MKSLKSLTRSQKTIGGAFYVGHGKTKFFSMPQWKISVIGLILGGVLLWALTAFIWLMLLADSKREVHERLAQSRFEFFDYLAMTERLFETTYRSEEVPLVEVVPSKSEGTPAAVPVLALASVSVQGLRYERVSGGWQVSFELHNLDKGKRLRGTLWLAGQRGERWVTYPEGVSFDSKALRLVQPSQGRGITVKNFSRYELLLPGESFQVVLLGIANEDGTLVFQQELALPPSRFAEENT